jgi:BMFP domain-containing protein YqiC
MNPALQKLLESLQATLPANLAADVKSNIEAVFKSNLEKLDLVTREQFDIQEKVLKRTRERLTVLENELAELEAKLDSVINGGKPK